MRRSSGGGGALWLVALGLALFVIAPVLTLVFAMPVAGLMGWSLELTLAPFGGLLAWVGAVALLAGGVTVGYRYTRRDGTDPALRELRHAYARGELSHEEYQRRRDSHVRRR